MLFDTLDALSPVDGRYRSTIEPLAREMSEAALIRARLTVMCEYVILFAHTLKNLPHGAAADDIAHILSIAHDVTDEQLAEIKAIETSGTAAHKATRHDVKACELFLRDQFMKAGYYEMIEWIHIGRTSEDINNTAYALMLRAAIQEAILPKVEEVRMELHSRAVRYARIPMLSRTHGQPATPTTLGKEFRVFEARLARQLEQLRNFKLLIKLNGASGNYCADVAAFPHVDWVRFSRGFCERLNGIGHVSFEINLSTTQIESHDTYAELFAILMRINTIILDASQDLWSYISEDWLVQKPVDGEVGSSAMPHKVNPIDFENAEGNIGIANALLEFMARKLPVSRRQRDLSDSTVERCMGMALGHSLIACTSFVRGIRKVAPDKEAIRTSLRAHPEVVTEAYQTILRSVGYPSGYDALKAISRGKKLTMELLHEFVDQLDPARVSPEVKRRMKAITPENYIGLAARIGEGTI